LARAIKLYHGLKLSDNLPEALENNLIPVESLMAQKLVNKSNILLDQGGYKNFMEVLKYADLTNLLIKELKIKDSAGDLEIQFNGLMSRIDDKFKRFKQKMEGGAKNIPSS